MSALRPIDRLFDQADLRCAVCSTSTRVGCDCHTKCQCGWFARKGEACRNPLHAREKAAQDVGHAIAGSVLFHMREMYPEPMKYASGGFAKTLRANIQHEAEMMVLEILSAEPEADEVRA
ncbi:hypothetical protein [Methylobacterium thuringiense]|uniref:MYND-type domain-containing protein n=1 Tax=Methylobacterium thuringiense TaxID=1003091 RepID=A0ABQ4TRL8_9HYPH|nr:hypothetical protein [Methylobacterium thuringiense]GJE57303.1 hypothetical protein EKPJFOCH_3817 [Methylobacterium thuringiense]